LETNPRHPAILVPPLVALLRNPRTEHMASLTLLAYATEDAIGAQADAVAAATAAVAELRLTDHPGTSGTGRDELESLLGVLLDLLARGPSSHARPLLARAAATESAWVALWGAVGLARLGVDPPADTLERVAASARCRVPLFRALEELGLLRFFPSASLTQEALAESEMVQWLLYPTELDAVPQAIELVGTAELALADGLADLYVFRFRAEAADEWLVGWSGPYLRSEQPTWGGSWTFSTFEPEGSQPPDQLVREIADSLTSDG
jgi:hypothetical protein